MLFNLVMANIWQSMRIFGEAFSLSLGVGLMALAQRLGLEQCNRNFYADLEQDYSFSQAFGEVGF